MLKKNKVIVLVILIGLMLLTAGCGNINKPIDTVDAQSGIWDKYFVYPLSETLNFFAHLLFDNYGLAIIIVTIFIRFLVLPLMITQIRSSKAMQQLQPEIKQIREKYKDNNQKIQEETMKLFQKHNVNPLAGCLPLIIQMPILIAFYHAISRNSHIASTHFLAWELGDPSLVLASLAAITTYLQMKLMGSGVSTSPQASQQQKIMTLVMPGMILFIGSSLPSALALYWVVGNLFTIVQAKYTKGIK